MQERIETIGEFLVSRGEAAELFETVEESREHTRSPTHCLGMAANA